MSDESPIEDVTRQEGTPDSQPQELAGADQDDAHRRHFEARQMQVGGMQSEADQMTTSKRFIIEVIFSGLKFFDTTGVKSQEAMQEEVEVCGHMMTRINVEKNSPLAAELWKKMRHLLGATLRTRRSTCKTSMRKKFSGELFGWGRLCLRYFLAASSLLTHISHSLSSWSALKEAGKLDYSLEQIKAFVQTDNSIPDPVVTANAGSDAMLVWACYHFLPCIVGDRPFRQKSVGMGTELTKLGTKSDIAFMLLILEYNYDEWKNLTIESDDNSTDSSKKKRGDHCFLRKEGPQERFYNLQLAVKNVKQARSDPINTLYKELVDHLEQDKRPVRERPTLTRSSKPKAKRMRCDWDEIQALVVGV